MVVSPPVASGPPFCAHAVAVLSYVPQLAKTVAAVKGTDAERTWGQRVVDHGVVEGAVAVA